MVETFKAPSPSDKNQHVKDYLSYYILLPHSPHYAVMINGPWGVGKTYLIKEFLRQHFGQDKKDVYVSLYGLATIDEIDAALFHAIYPALGWKVTRLGARVGKTLLKHIGFDSDFKIGEVINKFNADLFVFDDFERCEAPINKVLG
jgi:GTPase SAR1 family protein